MNPSQNDTNQTPEAPATVPEQQPTPPSPESPKSNKKLFMGIIVGIVVLLVVLIGLVAALLMKQNDSDGQSNNSASSESAETSNDAGAESSDKEIVKTVATENDKFELVIYKPQQKGSNTTFEYGIRNKCDGCEEKEYGALFSLSGNSSEAYVLDEDEGKKYSPIEDADGNPLATDSCGGRISGGETIDCFMAFTKVPSGKTVSLILGNLKIDGISVE